MKYCFLIFILAIVCCYGGALVAPNRGQPWETPEFYRNKTERWLSPPFENFTNFLQDRDPSISVPAKKLTTCIEENNSTEALENLLIDAVVQLKLNSDIQNRTELCDKNSKVINNFMQCVVEIGESPFSIALLRAADFIALEFCLSTDVQRVGELFEDLNFEILPEQFQKPFQRFREIRQSGKKSSGEDLCLPIRIAESFEVAAIQTRRFEFETHGPIGHFAHVLYSIIGNYPFKSYEDCAQFK